MRFKQHDSNDNGGGNTLHEQRFSGEGSAEEKEQAESTEIQRTLGEFCTRLVLLTGAHLLQVIKLVGERYNLMRALQYLQPTYIILYQCDIVAIRLLEIYATEKKLKKGSFLLVDKF